MTKPGKDDSVSSASGGRPALLAEESPAWHQELVPSDDQIRLRAYAIYVDRGDQPGNEEGDWLQAEREYLERS
jgi:transposase